MKLAILALLATGASASFSVRRLQDTSAPHPGECNIDSDCIDADHPEGICVPKATHSHDHLRRKLFGGVVYSGYCMDLVCMAGESDFYQAHAEGLFAGENSNPIPTIQEKGWCTDGTTDSWASYSYTNCSPEVQGQMFGYMTLACQCPGLDWSPSESPIPLVCSISDDMPAVCEETVKSLFMAETVAESGQEVADRTWASWGLMCTCPITDMDNMFCELADLPAECEGEYRPMVEQIWMENTEMGLTDAAAASAFWDQAKSMTICECGTQGGTRIPEGEEPQTGDMDISGWSARSLCDETYECKAEAMTAWANIAAFTAAMDTSGTYVAPTQSELEIAFMDICS